MEEQIEQIRRIAEKSLIYNKDINQHIISCKIIMVIINEQQHNIKELKNKLRIEKEKDKTIKIQGELIKEYSKIICEINNVQ